MVKLFVGIGTFIIAMICLGITVLVFTGIWVVGIEFKLIMAWVCMLGVVLSLYNYKDSGNENKS
jgi:uncharacterized membrane protein YccC